MMPIKQIPCFSKHEIFDLGHQYKVSAQLFQGKNIVIVDDIYLHPISVRNYILSVPSFPDVTAYPGWRSHSKTLSPLPQFIEKKIIKLYYPDMEDKLVIDQQFVGGILTTKSMTNDYSFKTHVDGVGLAGLIYFNTAEECSGGTQFYPSTAATVASLQIPMKFNRMVLYPMDVVHSGWILENSFDDYYRITQNLFFNKKI